MTTLLSSEDGRRCDATCYNAKHPDCDCICGGKCHGKGLYKAVELLQDDEDREPLLSVHFSTRNAENVYYGIINEGQEKDIESMLHSWGAKSVTFKSI